MSERSYESCKYLATDGAYCRLMDRPITSSILFERGCQHFEELKQTVFEHITQSVETLAEKLVYWEQNMPESGWTSEIIMSVHRKREEGIAATVEELKKEYKK